MLQQLFSTPNFDAYLVLGVLLFFGLIETLTGLYRSPRRNRDDWIQEMGSFFVLSLLIKPGIVATVLFIGNLISSTPKLFTNQNVVLIMIGYLLVDDLLQYWYHRSAHENPFLWKLHRAHHQAEEMGYFVSYRNAGLYYLLMPNIWWVGIVTYLGGGLSVAIGLVLKQLVIVSSHSTVKWDSIFYKSKTLLPFIKVIERVLITPAFHHAHHGVSKLDGVSDPNGNFGNMFSIWDQIFGSADFKRAYPKSYGLQKKTEDSWQAAYMYPLVKSKDFESELAVRYQKKKTSVNKPVSVDLKKGDSYLYCKCGLSQSQPFCDGSHHGTKYKPILFKGLKDGKSKLCNCKLSKNPPYCDDSHKALN